MALTSLIQREILYIRGLQIFLGKPFDISILFLFVSTTQHVLYVAIHKLGTSPIFWDFWTPPCHQFGLWYDVTFGRSPYPLYVGHVIYERPL